MTNPDMSAELKNEVAEAVRILREDGHAVHLSAIRAKLDKAFPDEPAPDPDAPPADPDAPVPPPKKDDPTPPAKDVKPRSRFSWWPPDDDPKARADDPPRP